MAQKIPRSVQLLLRSLPFDLPTTIVDVGANPIHAAPYANLLAAGGCHVIGFEPQAGAFAALQATKGANETYFPHAVGDGGAVTLNLFRYSGMASTFEPYLPGHLAFSNGKSARVLATERLQTVALDAVPDLPPFDLLKIDIQGGEVAVFNHARRVLANAVAVIVELRYHQLYEGEPMLGGVDTALRAQGFSLHKFLFNKSRMLRNTQADRLNPRRVADQLMDGDGVYIREPGRIADLPTQSIAHLALLAASVLDSPSLTLFCLDVLVARKVVPMTLPAAYVDRLPAALRRIPQKEIP